MAKQGIERAPAGRIGRLATRSGVTPRGRYGVWIGLFAALALCLPMIPRTAPAAVSAALSAALSKVQLVEALQSLCGDAGGPAGPSHRPDAAPHDHEHCLRCAASGVIAPAPPMPVAACRFSGVLVEAGPTLRPLPRREAAASPYRSRAPPVLA